jgi:fructose-1,6-bisphosphatase I
MRSLQVGLSGENVTPIIDEGEKYVAVFDPLDGSSNVDAGIPT